MKKIKNLEQILERQDAHIRFENGKVKYFSVSTQHGTANTLEKAIKNIVKADKEFNGKSEFAHFVERLESEYGMQI